MRIARISAACLAALLLPLVGTAEISASKRALIVELVEISSGPDFSIPAVRQFLRELQPHYADLVADVMTAEQDLDPAQREALARQLSDFDAFAVAFVARFPQEVDLDGVLVEAYLPLYDRHFDEPELEAIMGFYRSPPGRKMIRVLPPLIQEGVTSTMELIQPQLMRVVGRVLAQRRQELVDQGEVR
jgi:hypothetical protein